MGAENEERKCREVEVGGSQLKGMPVALKSGVCSTQSKLSEAVLPKFYPHMPVTWEAERQSISDTPVKYCVWFRGRSR